jgi:hypothetical protein
MRTKLFILLAILFGATTWVSAQTSFSCSSFETCLLNEDLEPVNCVETKKPCLFVVNEAETVITHTSEEDKIIFYVTDRESDESMIAYKVKSEEGEDFLFMFMLDGEEIMMYFEDEDGDFLVTFYVKAIF